MRKVLRCVGSRVRNEGARPFLQICCNRGSGRLYALASTCSTCELSHVAALPGMRRRARRLEWCGSVRGRATGRDWPPEGALLIVLGQSCNICSRFLFKNIIITNEAMTICQKEGTLVCVRNKWWTNLFLLNYWFCSELKTCLVQSNANQCRLFIQQQCFCLTRPGNRQNILSCQRAISCLSFFIIQTQKPLTGLCRHLHIHIGHREYECRDKE